MGQRPRCSFFGTRIRGNASLSLAAAAEHVSGEVIVLASHGSERLALLVRNSINSTICNLEPSTQLGETH